MEERVKAWYRSSEWVCAGGCWREQLLSFITGRAPRRRSDRWINNCNQCTNDKHIWESDGNEQVRCTPRMGVEVECARQPTPKQSLCPRRSAQCLPQAVDKHSCGDATRPLVGAWRVEFFMQLGGDVPRSNSDHTAHLQPSPARLVKLGEIHTQKLYPAASRAHSLLMLWKHPYGFLSLPAPRWIHSENPLGCRHQQWLKCYILKHVFLFSRSSCSSARGCTDASCRSSSLKNSPMTRQPVLASSPNQKLKSSRNFSHDSNSTISSLDPCRGRGAGG